MMDFHFYQANKPAIEGNSSLKQTLKPFVPIFLLAAMLPIFIGLVRRPTDVHLESQAGLNEVNVWIEPSQVMADHSGPITLTVKAFFEGSDASFLPGLKVPLTISGPAALTQATVSYGKPFKGQVTLGEVTVIPQREGNVEVFIDKGGVVSAAFSSVLQVTTSSSLIQVH